MLKSSLFGYWVNSLVKTLTLKQSNQTTKPLLVAQCLIKKSQSLATQVWGAGLLKTELSIIFTEMLTNLLKSTADTTLCLSAACWHVHTVVFQSCEPELTGHWGVRPSSRSGEQILDYTLSLYFVQLSRLLSLCLIDVFSYYHCFCSLPPCLSHSFSTLFLVLGATWQAGSVTGCCWHNKPSPLQERHI